MNAHFTSLPLPLPLLRLSPSEKRRGKEIENRETSQVNRSHPNRHGTTFVRSATLTLTHITSLLIPHFQLIVGGGKRKSWNIVLGSEPVYNITSLSLCCVVEWIIMMMRMGMVMVTVMMELKDITATSTPHLYLRG